MIHNSGISIKALFLLSGGELNALYMIYYKQTVNQTTINKQMTSWHTWTKCMDKDEKNWITWNRMLMKDISKMRIFRLDSKESFQHRHRSNKSGRDFQTMGPKKEKHILLIWGEPLVNWTSLHIVYETWLTFHFRRYGVQTGILISLHTEPSYSPNKRKLCDFLSKFFFPLKYAFISWKHWFTVGKIKASNRVIHYTVCYGVVFYHLSHFMIWKTDWCKYCGDGGSGMCRYTMFRDVILFYGVAFFFMEVQSDYC